MKTNPEFVSRFPFPVSRLPGLGHGVGLRSEHFQEILETRPRVDWFEAISENFMDSEGRPLSILEKIRADYPVGLHGTSLSIGSADGLHQPYLDKLKKLVDRIQPAIVSDHLCWAAHGETRLFDLLPLPFTEESLRTVVQNTDHLQNFLGRRILLENVSAYVAFKHSEMTEWDFLNEAAKQSGCGILLDVNNIFVNSFNHGFDPLDYLNGLAPDFVFQFHISGHTNHGKFLFDTHTGEVIEPVWNLYAEAVKRFGAASSLIEWDSDIRSFKELEALNEKSRQIAKDNSTAYRVPQNLVPRNSYRVRPSPSPLPRQGERTGVGMYSVRGTRYSLNEVQRWFAGEILPGKKNLAPLKDVLNDQGGEPGIVRLAVYAEGYPARIHEALAEVYPAVQKILGESGFSDLTTAFAGSRPFKNYNLNRVADFFTDFLQMTEWREKFPFICDLAELELAVHRSFHAGLSPAATGADFSEKAGVAGELLIFHFQPHVFGIRSHWPVLDIWHARGLPREQIKIQVEGRPQAVLVYRRGEKVVCQKADALEIAVLQSLQAGNPLGQAFDVLAEADDMTPVQAWFSGWLVNGLITDFSR